MKKRKRGRPKDTKKWPREYYLLLLELRHRLRDGETLSSLCRDICTNGGIKFVVESGKVIEEITKWRTLHSRISEAKMVLRPIWKLQRPDYPDEAFRVSLWRGCPWMCVPAKHTRRLALAELSLGHKTKLHK
jgi:hypothetical protein